MKQISLNGTFSVGKSTVANQLKDKFKDHLHTPDLARHYLERMQLNSNTMTPAQRKELQLNVAASYIGYMRQAEHAKKDHIMDSSLIEVYAYSDGVLLPEQLIAILHIIEKYKDSMLALVIPPTIKLEDDGLRHTDKEFRITIHQKIMDVIHAFNIEYQFILGTTVEERVKEVCSYIEK